MMRQYRRIKGENSDAILFFRLGDFYEMFESDARKASSLLNLTLTKRNGIPMCGIPYHAAAGYIGRLLNAGQKIAVCEQVELPGPGKGIARREVKEIITPGTVVDENYLDKGRNNYLLALAPYRGGIALAYADLSTGEFCVNTLEWENREELLKRELLRLAPREVILPESLLEEDPGCRRIFDEKSGDLLINRMPDWYFDAERGEELLKKQYGVVTLKGFGLRERDPVLVPCGVLLEYIGQTAKSVLPHLHSLKRVEDHRILALDESSLRNLEIMRNLQDGTRHYTLLAVLDHTKTAMGGRLLKSWLLNPLRDPGEITARQDKVAWLYKNQIVLNSSRDLLGGILDIERLAGRIALDKAHARDLLALGESMEGALKLEETLRQWGDPSETEAPDGALLETIARIRALIETAILPEPSVLLSEGKMIRRGYNHKLDELKDLRENSQDFLKQYLEKEKSDSGINSLKIKYNKIIGHYLEVTKANLALVPDHFIRRQSLVGAERFTTDRLGELEDQLNSAAEKVIELERELFIAIRSELKGYLREMMLMGRYIAHADCLASFAYAATLHGYTRPKMSRGSTLVIREGRHPVVEAHLNTGEFIPNSLELDPDRVGFSLITGPNMAGKSTFLRQTALIILMAQTGSFVPAAEARIGCVDKIFCRVGASDNLARGESTFLVEMNETAYILRSATAKSLVIMDEVGRGTGTTDGLSLAWAVTEYLLDKVGAKTLFATHYHELTALEHPGIRNLSLQVREEDGEIVFLKQVREGPSDNSYGIHVARLAGLPQEVIIRAGELQRELGAEPLRPVSDRPANRREGAEERDGKSPQGPQQGQSDLFGPEEMVLNELASIDLNMLTPLEALNRLSDWKERLDG